MSEKVNQLQKFVNWEKVYTWWLHLVWTADTKELVEKVKNKIQALLDIAHMKAKYPSIREEITSEIIPNYKEFACWELISTLEDSIRWKHVYLFSDPSWDYQEEVLEEDFLEEKKKWPRWTNNKLLRELLKARLESSLNDKLLHDLFALSLLKTHWAKTTNLVQACMPYARQDDMTPKKRQPASLEYLWKSISTSTWEDGYVITADIHNNSAARWVFSNTNFVNLYTWWFIEECINDIKWDNIVLSWADQWWDKKISAISDELKSKYIVVLKTRDYTKENVVDETDVYWDIEWRDILIHDDMLDTGWTMCTLLREMLKKKPRSINIAVTHGMFNWKALERLEKVIKESNWVIQNVYITNSINKKWLPDFIKQVDLSNMLANNILRIYKGLGLERNDNTDYSK